LIRKRLTAAMAAVLLLQAVSGAACGGDRDQGRDLSVILVIIDTMRADRLGTSGSTRNLTPTLDSLAASGALFTHAQSQSSWTLPAVASILTGLTPRQHGAVRTGATTCGLAPGLPTLQGMLHARGWETGGFFNVLFLSEDFGFHRGFDHFDCQGVCNRLSLRNAAGTVDDVIAWLGGLEPGSRFLAVVHFYDPHIPYAPPPPFDTLYTDPSYSGSCGAEWGNVLQLNSVNDGDSTLTAAGLANLVALYDGEIAFTDRETGRLLSWLRGSGLADSTIVVVVGDHGEEFYEHSGIEHGRTFYQEITRIPLIFSGPGIPAGSMITEPVSQIDIVPTVLAMLGLPPETGQQGRDLFALSAAVPDIEASNLLWCAVQEVSVLRGALKLIWLTDGSGAELYDLTADPMELNPLTVTDSSLLEAAEFYWSTPPLFTPPVVPFEESMNRQLRDLGYIR
jgi:choline-sulfatase